MIPKDAAAAAAQAELAADQAIQAATIAKKAEAAILKCRYRKRDRERYAADPEGQRAKSRAYYAANRDKKLAAVKAYQARRREEQA